MPPKLWCHGRYDRKRSSGVTFHIAASARCCERMLSCESTTPFMRPLVPDVYIIRHGVDGSSLFAASRKCPAAEPPPSPAPRSSTCLLYTSDAADDLTRVDLG